MINSSLLSSIHQRLNGKTTDRPEPFSGRAECVHNTVVSKLAVHVMTGQEGAWVQDELRPFITHLKVPSTFREAKYVQVRAYLSFTVTTNHIFIIWFGILLTLPSYTMMDQTGNRMVLWPGQCIYLKVVPLVTVIGSSAKMGYCFVSRQESKIAFKLL